MTLDLVSERYSPSGSMAARTLTQAVRNSSLDEWAVLLRETLQNSVDARLTDAKPIGFRVTLDHASTVQRSTLQKQIFSQIPANLAALTRSLKALRLPLLVVADWHTRGLGGPTRADRATDERADFRDFFLNTGREESKGYQGGTFGLGRGVLFDISVTGAIVVYTRTFNDGRAVNRLMGMAIGEGFDKGGMKHTGRHWWGRQADDFRVQPVTGSEADLLAKYLSLDLIPEGTTGTAIMVIGPQIPDDTTLEEALDEMIDAALLYGWPLMIGRLGKPAVKFEFGLNERLWNPIHPASPESPVRRFVQAYQLAEDASALGGPSSWHRSVVKFGAGRAQPVDLGVLTFRHFPPENPVGEADEEEQGIPASSIALMRKPRMVVRYLPVARHPQGSSTVGVFVADPAFDDEFADSEPVAHDDWIPANIAIEKFARNPVKQALDKIKKGVKDSWQSSTPTVGDGGGADGIAPVLADLLGGMLSETTGFGGRPTQAPGQTPGAGRGTPKSARVHVNTPALRIGKGGVVTAVFPVEVVHGSTGGHLRIGADPRVLTDGGVEPPSQHPEGADLPEVIGWESSGGAFLGSRSDLVVSRDVTVVACLIRQPHDTAVTVDIRVEELSS